MRKKSTFLLIILSYIAFLVFMRESVADMVFNPIDSLPIYFISCFIGFFITILIEYLIGYRFAEKSHFFSKGIVLTNLISYPIAQLILGVSYFIVFYRYLLFIIIVVEFSVIFIEWYFLSLFYKICSKERISCFGKIDTKTRILYYVILANLISYFIGSIMFFSPFPETSIIFWIINFRYIW